MEAAAITALLPKLAAMLADEYELHSGVAAGVRYLQDELTSMQAALEAAPPAAAGHGEDAQLNLWARTVRELAYDADDTVDSYGPTWCASPPGRRRRRRYKARRRIAGEIESIKSEVREASDRRRRFWIPDAGIQPPRSPAAAPPADPRLHLLYENAAGLVGMGAPTEELARKLSLEAADGGGGEEDARSQRLKMVAVVGAGGIGKTTLAREVYDKFRDKFDCVAFVTVSQNPDLEIVLGKILRQVSQTSSEMHQSCREEEIIQRIRDVLEDKR
ncbi:unnamed protein product [Urochloa humidicola]